MYGPNSVGGAINMVTGEFEGNSNRVEVIGGTFNQMQAKVTRAYGANSVYIQATRKNGDLIRQTSGRVGDDYDFLQNDLLFKYGA